jgi:hypothetical protein
MASQYVSCIRKFIPADSFVTAAYFTQATVDQLGTVDDITGVCDLVVPSGLFQSTRVGKNRKVDDPSRNVNDTLKPVMTSSVTRTYAPFPAAYPNRRRSRSPQNTGSSKLYEAHQNISNVHVPPIYSEAQITQYSAPSAAPLPQNPPLPPLRDLHQPSFDVRRQYVPPISQHVSGYSPQYLYDRPSSVDHVAPGTEQASHRAAGVIAGNPKSSPNQVGLSPASSPLHIPHRNQTHPAYTSDSETVARCDTHSLSRRPSNLWYSHPNSHLDDHADTIPIRTEMTTYPVRTSYPPLLEPSISVPPTLSYSQSETLSYVSLQSDPQSQMQPQIPPQLPSHTYLSKSHSLSSSSPSSTTQHSSPCTESSYFPSFESYHLGESCGIDMESRRGSIGPSRVDLAPLHALQRNHPYRRDPVDDRALRMLGPRSS